MKKTIEIESGLVKRLKKVLEYRKELVETWIENIKKQQSEVWFDKSDQKYKNETAFVLHKREEELSEINEILKSL